MFMRFVRALDGIVDRTKREKRKQSKLNRETWFQEVRVETRKAAGRLARTKAKADSPIRRTRKRKPKAKAPR